MSLDNPAFAAPAEWRTALLMEGVHLSARRAVDGLSPAARAAWERATRSSWEAGAPFAPLLRLDRTLPVRAGLSRAFTHEAVAELAKAGLILEDGLPLPAAVAALSLPGARPPVVRSPRAILKGLPSGPARRPDLKRLAKEPHARRGEVLPGSGRRTMQGLMQRSWGVHLTLSRLPPCAQDAWSACTGLLPADPADPAPPCYEDGVLDGRRAKAVPEAGSRRKLIWAGLCEEDGRPSMPAVLALEHWHDSRFPPYQIVPFDRPGEIPRRKRLLSL